MSLKTWKKEFYPTKPSHKWTWLECIEHSLRKWRGATEENCQKHNVEFSGFAVHSD